MEQVTASIQKDMSKNVEQKTANTVKYTVRLAIDTENTFYMPSSCSVDQCLPATCEPRIASFKKLLHTFFYIIFIYTKFETMHHD